MKYIFLIIGIGVLGLRIANIWTDVSQAVTFYSFIILYCIIDSKDEIIKQIKLNK